MIILLFSQELICAQTPERVQLGTVRSQSYTGRKSSPIKDAIIRRKDGNVNPAKSDNNGDFELSMENISTMNDVYYIESVEVNNNTKKYELFSPLPDDAQQYKPNAKLIIVMHSESEWNTYMNQRIAETDSYYAKKYADSLAILNDRFEKSQITEQERDSLSNELLKLRQNAPKLIKAYLQNIEAKTDFESLDSTKQVFRKAIYENNIGYAKKLLLEFGSFDENIEEYLELVNCENAIHEISIRKADDLLFAENGKIEIGLKEGDFESVLRAMRNRLRVKPNNVDYLCELGLLEETIFNLYKEAKTNYSRALEQAISQNLSSNEVAICHNHLGDIYLAMSEYTLAEEHYTQASLLLESFKDGKSNTLFDTYLGLGNVHYDQANFDKAFSFYKKCADAPLASVSKKVFWQGRIGIGKIKYVKGDYQGARSYFDSILKEIISSPDIKDIDIATTLSMAYNSMIECMTTVGQYQEAIEFCDVAIDVIKKRSTPKNTYIADLLIYKGDTYLRIGKIKEGTLCMNEAIGIYLNILGENHPRYANACVKFADYFILIGELGKADEMSTKALEVLKRKFGNNHLATAEAHLSKCNLYSTMAEYEKAQNEIDTIKAMYKSTGFLNDYNRSQISCLEAGIKIAQGECPRGIKVFQEAIDCVINTLGNESKPLIDIYNYIAMTYLDQLENGKAKDYIDKAQSLANKIFGSDSPSAVMQQMGMGQYYVNIGEYHKAFKLFSKIEQVVTETYGTDNYQLCVLYSKLGDYHLGQYQFDKAFYYYDKFYEIVKTTYGENHYFIAEPITRLGAYYMQIGDFNKGLEKEKLAYDILSAHFGIAHKATFMSLLGICSAYIQLGDFDMAESVSEDLSKSVAKQLGNNNGFYTDILRIKAILALKRGELHKAIGFIEEAINIIELIFGPYHSNSIQFYDQLAELYSNMCDIPKAIEYNNITISLATNHFGKDNVGVMPFLLRKGYFCASLNQISDAHELFDKVKNVYVTHFGPSCTQLSTVLIPEAELLIQEGYGERALDILKWVEQQMISIYGDNNIQLNYLYNTMADAYLAIAQFKNARLYYQKSIDIIKRSLGANNVNIIKPLVGLGNVCLSEDAMGQQKAEANRLYNRAWSISANIYGVNHVNTTGIDARIGFVSLQSGKLQDAYKKFQKHLSSVLSYLGELRRAHSLFADAHMNMGLYYIAKANDSLLKQGSLNYNQYASNAKDEFTQAKSIIETIYGKDYAGLATSLNAIAQTQFLLQQPDSAITNYIKAAELTINQFGKHSPLVAQAYATLGFAYNYKSEQYGAVDEETLTEAKEYYKKAIELRGKSQGNSREILMTSTMDWRLSLSAIYMKLYDYENAFKTIDKIIYELDGLQLENKSPLYTCYFTKANMIITSGRDPKEALDLLFQANDLFPYLSFSDYSIKEFKYSQLLATFGLVYEETGDTNEARESYEKAYEKLRLFSNNPQVDIMKQTLRDKIKELEK